MMNPEILYEDNHLLVVYKPIEVLSQADSSNRIDMLTILKKYIKEKYNKPGDVYLGLVHRLDYNTSGVMVYARTSKAAARLALSMQNGEFKKKYYAIVEGIVEAKTLTNYLLKDENEKKSYVNKNGKLAILDYKPIKTLKYKGVNSSLIDVSLKTGRFHQIRCQMAYIGHPLVGDNKYGSKINCHYYLDCYSLSFPHPISKEILTFNYEKRRNQLF